MGDISHYFNRSEFACKCGCGFQTVDHELLKVLEHLRGEFGAPITINSACRCDAHNKNIGGASGSKHKQGIAADIVIKGVDPSVVYSYLIGVYSSKYGIGNYTNFTHIDVRSIKARWEG